MAHRYNQKFDEAYCKYCYKTHRLWQRFWDVFPDEVVWECGVCEHRTKDENMQIEKHASSLCRRLLFLHEEIWIAITGALRKGLQRL
jgi:hypothetical protein